LAAVIDLYLERTGLGGSIYISRVAFRLGEKSGPEPDIAYVKEEHIPWVLSGYVDGPPDIAIEIVSWESVERDYEKKRLQYQEGKVPEYWIVDPLEHRVTVLRLDPAGEYREIRRHKGKFHSRVLKGF
jgi:Uma2 family endonuclease